MASEVQKILDAASLAASRKTFDDMLNQLPGLLVEQQRYRDAKETEDKRYADLQAFQNRQYNDLKDARDYSSDVELVKIGTELEGDSAITYFDNLSLKTDSGRSLANSVSKSKKVTIENNNNLNLQIKNLYTNIDNMTYDEALNETNALKLDLESKNIKRDLSTIDKKVAVKQGREFANGVLDIVDFGANEDEIRNVVNSSQNPTEIFSFVVTRLDKEKLDSIENEKDKNKLFTDLSNALPGLINAGAPQFVINNVESKLNELSRVDSGEPSGTTERKLSQEEINSLGKDEERVIVDENTGNKYLYSNKTGTVKLVGDDFNLEVETDQQKLDRLMKERKLAKTRDDFNKIDSQIKSLQSKSSKTIQQNVEEQSYIGKEVSTLPIYDILSY